jgi:membrane fusion protein (multidrug efflux system)
LGAANGSDWIVQSGLKAGDRVIVDGLLKAFPGMTVNPMEIGSSNAPAANQ